MAITKIEIFKDGERVAICDANIREVDLTVGGFPPMTAFSLPQVELERIKIFEHLNGRPLSAFFNEAGIHISYVGTDAQIEPIFYVHGRSETMRGNTTISAVVLIHFDCSDEELPKTRQLALQLPRIYREINKAL